MKNLKILAASAAIAGACLITSAFAADGLSETGRGGGTPGMDAHAMGNVEAARDIYAHENAMNPNDPYPQYNLAGAYNAMGQRDRAITYYRQAVQSGHGVHPTRIYEAHRSGATISQAACQHLRDLQASDDGCEI